MKRTVELTYYVRSKVKLIFDDSGGLVDLNIDGKNCTENGDSIDSVLQAIEDAGHDLQLDISQAFDGLYLKD